MALVKETGEGLADANVYADATDLASFADMRNIDLTAYTETQIYAALFISAQDWMDDLHEFEGSKLSDEQSMKLPTDKVSLPNDDIVAANCMTAIQQLKGLLFIEVTAADKFGEITKLSTKLDKLEKSTTYAEGSSNVGGVYATDKADAKLKPYLSIASSENLLVVV